MRGMLRVALVVVMAMVFGLAGFVSNSDAATVNYYEMQSNGVNIASGITTTGPTGCLDPTGTYEVELSTNSGDLCATDYRYTAGTNGMVYSRTYFNTAYAVDTTVTGISYRVTIRDPSTFSFQLFHVNAGGTRTYLGSPVNATQGAAASASFLVDLSGQSGTVPAGSKLGLETIAVASGGRVYIGSQDSRGVGQISGHLIVDESVACAETATVNAVNPGVITGASAITANLGGTGGSNPEVRWSIDGGAFSAWQNSGATLTPPASSTGTVTIEARATGSCGTITDATPVNTTYDTTCTESTQSSIIWTGTTVANGDFSGASFVTLTDITAASMQYKVTEGSGPGAPTTIQSEDWESKSSAGQVFTPHWTDDGSCWYTHNGAQTPSGNVNGSGSMYVYLESSDAGQAGPPPSCGLTLGNTYTFEQTTTMDASNYAITFDFWMNNEAGDASDVLVLDVWNGSSWDTGVTTIQTGPTAANGTTKSIDLDALGYNSGNIRVRFSYTLGNTGSIFAKDLLLDDFVFTGTPRNTETTVIDWTTDPISASGVLTNGNSYNLYARGLDAECGANMYYGDPSASNNTPDGTSQTFTWNDCTTTGSIIWDGAVSTANGDFAGTDLVSSTSNLSGNVEYQVTGSSVDFGDCRVEGGTTSFAGATGSVTLTTPIADLTKAFVLVDSTSDQIAGADPGQNHHAVGEITAADTVTFTRSGTTGNAQVSYQVVECPGNLINVQRGNISMTAGGAASGTATISAVNAAQSIVIVNARTDAGSSGASGEGWVTGDLSAGNTTVTVTRGQTTTNVDVHYQVVEFGGGATVSTGTIADVNGISGTPDTVAVSVNDATSWLYFSNTCGTTGLDDCNVAGNIAGGGSQLNFYQQSDVVGTNALRWYVVEFPAGEAAVQRGQSTYTNSTDPVTHNITISNVDTAKSFSFTTNNVVGDGTDMPRGLWIEEITSGTNLAMHGWNSDTVNADSEFEWQVIEFTGGGAGETTLIPWSTDPLTPAASSVLTDGNSYNIYARGTDASCGTTVYGDNSGTNTTADGTAKSFTWSSCNETASVSLNAISDPITGSVTISATLGGSGGSNVEVSDDNATWNVSPWTYNPPASGEGTVTFYAQADGACGKVSDPTPVTVNYDTLVPSVTSTTPTNGATGIAKDSSVTINFNQNIDCATVDTASVTILPATTTWTRTSCSGSTAVFAPTGQANTTAYTVTVDSSISDLSGNNMAGNYQFSYTTDCTDLVASSISFNGANTAAGNFFGSTMVNTVDLSNLEFRVTETTSGTPTSLQLDNWDTGYADNAQVFTPNWTDDGSCWWTYTGTQTPSAANGSDTGAPISGRYVYLEGSAAGQTNGCGLADGTYYFEQTSTLDAGAYILEFNFDYAATGADGTTPRVLYLDVWNGASWDNQVVTIHTGPTTGTQSASIDLDALGYNSGQVKVRFQYNTGAGGNFYQKDLAFDNMEFIGTPRSVGENEVIAWNADPQEAGGVLTNGNTYTLYARGVDAECGLNTYYVGGGAAPGTGQSFTWSSCTENQTLTLTPVTDPVTGAVSITATGTASNILVGDTNPPTQASGWTYNPPQDDNTSTVTFYAQGDGDCGPMLRSQTVNISTMQAPTITGFVVPANVTDTAAPYEIPITTFTATDNVAVTGWMITIDDPVAPGSGDAGWLGSAPASVTVPGYATYTLRAYTKDAAGNVSTTVSQVTTVSNCTETASVTLDPITAPITAPVAITASLGGTGGSSPEVSWDGSTWHPSGTTFTPGVQSDTNGEFYARATGSCGVILDPANPTSVAIDTRTDYLESNLAEANQAGLTSITVIMGYCGDRDGSGTYQVDYKLASSGTWTIGTPQNDASNDGSYTITLTGLTVGETYDIRMIYDDPVDGVIAGTDPTTQQVQVALQAWSDDPMLHNALRFACDLPGYWDQTSCEGAGGAWTLNRKWAGGWGTDTGEYGPIMCGTCHAKDTGNVKKVQNTITASSGNFPGSTVNLQTVTDGSSDLGDDTGGHGTSDRICEVCHTQTNYHRFNTAGQSGGTGHYNQADCIKCHEHKIGFRASCNACHGNPPTQAGELTNDLNPVNTTNSTTWGEHAAHAGTLAYDCNVCHTGWAAAGEMPKSGNINIGYDIPFGTAVIDGGTYDGRTAGSGGSYTANGPTGTTVTQGGAMSCSVYCHGYAAPVWNPASTAACGACHGQVGGFGDSRDGAPDGNVYPGAQGGRTLGGAQSGTIVGKHFNHLDNSAALTGNACGLCHPNGDAHVGGALDGTVQVVLNTAFAGAGASYSGGTCSNMSCHGDMPWDSAASGGCDLCHGYPPNSTNNSHAAGVNPVNHDSLNILPNHDDCSYCHGYKNNGSDQLAFADVAGLKGSWTPTATYHQDGQVTLNGNTNATTTDDAGYNSGNGGCDTAACHANDATHRVGGGGTGNTIRLADIGPGSCGTCHDGGVGGAPIVNASSSHVEVTRGGGYGDCTDCHAGHTTASGGVDIPNNTTVGIDYSSTGHNGIQLGGTGTHSSINSFTTEAQICWGCHDADGSVSEWGVNSKANTGSSPYNYGNVTSSNWTTATWSSSRSQYAYKTGAIQSTHTANPLVTDANLGGADYNKTETKNAVGDIRCSYCHDVHDLNRLGSDTVSGSPYLRGTWRGNPYEEDGAPRRSYANTTYFGNVNGWGSVPRGSVNQNKLGGYWIDQNNVVPMTATTGGNGTAAKNPTSGWTLANSAGLCTVCHGSDVNNMDEKTGENLWLGTNGHANSAIGGTGTASPNEFNVFNARGASTTLGTGNAPYTHYDMTTMSYNADGPADATNGTGFRSANGDALMYTPYLNNGNTRPMKADRADYEWGPGATPDANTVDNQYHKFSCSKCHNPHASRLPKLMITNCLDTRHNTWDNQFQLSTTQGAANTNKEIANWTSAQNCHRYSALSNSGDTTEINRTVSGTQTATSMQGAGWNKVTPWTSSSPTNP